MPKGSQVGGFDPLPLVYTVIVFAAALFVPAVLDRFVSRPGGSDSDSGEDGGGGGGGGGSGPPPIRPNPPPGGVPLDDARPARVRLRDERRLAQRLPSRERRPVREPAHSPARRTPAGH